MSSIYRITLLISILLLSFLLISCGSEPEKDLPEGNIDVDSEIYIVPIGDVDEKYLYPLVPMLEKRYTTKVHVAPDKRMPEPDYAYDYETKKYIAMYIISELFKVEVPEGAKVLGVANVDLYVHRTEENYIFGQAQFGRNSKVALISMFRMNPFSYVGGKRDDELLIERMIKESIHELGHVFGLRNCPEPECVMYLARDLRSLDKKTDNFCLNCQKEYRVFSKPEDPDIQTSN